jgi:hypothetical protein
MVHDVKHKHHIVPQYEGGSNDPFNLVELTVTQHAMWHFAEWQRKGREEDRLAWKGLAGHTDATYELLRWANLRQPWEAKVLGGQKGGERNKELYYDSGKGLFSKDSKRKAIQSAKENGRGRFDSKLQSDLGKKAAEKNRENGTGAFFDKTLQSEAGKSGSKVTNSQKWRCTVTGHITTSGPLTCYQKARGIDPSNRERVTG